jgi:Methyltransferase domain
VTALAQPQTFSDVKGWFRHPDIVLFDWFLDRQRRTGQSGDLLEMGAYLGKSAIMMRAYLGADETLTVCDLFDSDAPDAVNAREMGKSYATLTRRAFESNFRAFHDELPRIIQGPTSVVPSEVVPGSCRFVHVDASHLYEHVHADIGAAREALGRDGIVVLDDYRAEHTPGVACAVWQAVVESGLRPVCLSAAKFYGTWGDAEAVQDDLLATLGERDDCWVGAERIAGRRVLRVNADKVPGPRMPAARFGVASVAPAVAVAPAVRAFGGRSGATRRIVRELLPPVVARPLARRMRGR